MRRLSVGGLTFALILTGLSLAQEGPRGAVHDIEDYVVYYGKGELEALSTFDLAIIQPDTLTRRRACRAEGGGDARRGVSERGRGRTRAALVLGTGRVDPRWLLSKNENWGSYRVDANQEGWRKLMGELTGEFLGQRFRRGCFWIRWIRWTLTLRPSPAWLN